MSLLGGEARLIGDLELAPSTAAGELLLTGERVRLAMADEELAGDLRVELFEDQRAFHIVDAWDRFDGYAPGRTSLQLSTKAGGAPNDGPAVKNASYDDSAPPAVDAIGDQVSDRAAIDSGDTSAGDEDRDDVFLDGDF